eukprot:jgi/Mesvir1/27343/Mv07159-RA.1
MTGSSDGAIRLAASKRITTVRAVAFIKKHQCSQRLPKRVHTSRQFTPQRCHPKLSAVRISRKIAPLPRGDPGLPWAKVASHSNAGTVAATRMILPTCSREATNQFPCEAATPCDVPGTGPAHSPGAATNAAPAATRAPAPITTPCPMSTPATMTAAPMTTRSTAHVTAYTTNPGTAQGSAHGAGRVGPPTVGVPAPSAPLYVSEREQEDLAPSPEAIAQYRALLDRPSAPKSFVDIQPWEVPADIIDKRFEDALAASCRATPDGPPPAPVRLPKNDVLYVTYYAPDSKTMCRSKVEVEKYLDDWAKRARASAGAQTQGMAQLQAMAHDVTQGTAHAQAMAEWQRHVQDTRLSSPFFGRPQKCQPPPAPQSTAMVQVSPAAASQLDSVGPGGGPEALPPPPAILRWGAALPLPHATVGENDAVPQLPAASGANEAVRPTGEHPQPESSAPARGGVTDASSGTGAGSVQEAVGGVVNGGGNGSSIGGSNRGNDGTNGRGNDGGDGGNDLERAVISRASGVADAAPRDDMDVGDANRCRAATDRYHGGGGTEDGGVKTRREDGGTAGLLSDASGTGTGPVLTALGLRSNAAGTGTGNGRVGTSSVCGGSSDAGVGITTGNHAAATINTSGNTGGGMRTGNDAGAGVDVGTTSSNGAGAGIIGEGGDPILVEMLRIETAQGPAAAIEYFKRAMMERAEAAARAAAASAVNKDVDMGDAATPRAAALSNDVDKTVSSDVDKVEEKRATLHVETPTVGEGRTVTFADGDSRSSAVTAGGASAHAVAVGAMAGADGTELVEQTREPGSWAWTEGGVMREAGEGTGGPKNAEGGGLLSEEEPLPKRQKTGQLVAIQKIGGGGEEGDPVRGNGVARGGDVPPGACVVDLTDDGDAAVDPSTLPPPYASTSTRGDSLAVMADDRGTRGGGVGLAPVTQRPSYLAAMANMASLQGHPAGHAANTARFMLAGSPFGPHAAPLGPAAGHVRPWLPMHQATDAGDRNDAALRSGVSMGAAAGGFATMAYAAQPMHEASPAYTAQPMDGALQASQLMSIQTSQAHLLVRQLAEEARSVASQAAHPQLPGAQVPMAQQAAEAVASKVFEAELALRTRQQGERERLYWILQQNGFGLQSQDSLFKARFTQSHDPQVF